MIKSWLQFIKESKSNDSKIWTLSEDDILEYLIDFVHNNYFINVEFGFCEKKKDAGKIKNIFTRDVEEYDVDYTPAYYVTINWNQKTENENITDSLIFFIDSIKEIVGGGELFGAEVELSDDDGILDIDDILVKGRIFKDGGNLEIKDTLYIVIIENKKVELSNKEYCDYFGWKYDESTNETAYIHIDLEEMANCLLEYKSRYVKMLVDGIDDSYYYQSDYEPDMISLIQYTLDKENKQLLIKCITKEYGGLEELKKYIYEEYENDEIFNIDEEGLIEFLLGERFYRTLDFISKESKIMSDIKEICADWEMQAHIDENNENLWEEFIEVVDENIKDYTIIEKEVEKYYTSRDGQKMKYKDIVKFFSIPFDIEWVKHMDYDMKDYFSSLESVFHEWCSYNSFNYDLNPKWSDYGHVNKDELNREIKAILTHYLIN